MRSIPTLYQSNLTESSTIMENFLTSCTNNILNKHAPEFRNVIKKPKTFELDINLKNQFKLRGSFYKKYIKTKDDTYLKKYRKMRTDIKLEVRKRKDEFIKRDLENPRISSTLWQIFDSLGLTSTVYNSSLQ